MSSRHSLSKISHETDWQDRRVTVMGLGSFGGGIASVRFLAERGARVRVSDRKDETTLAESLSHLSDFPNVEFRLGGHDWSHFEDADLAVLNPAIRFDDPIVERIRQSGVPTASEIELFWQLNRGRVIGVTGSNGKSTTTALTHHVLKAALAESGSNRQAWLGGNIGRSLLPHVDEIHSDDWVVLELSSFQLKALNQIQARPDVAVVTNFAPNHLDWHGTLQDYRESKQTLLRWQTEADYCVTTRDDEVASWPGNARRILTGPGEEIQIGEARSEVALPAMKLRGQHNRQNAVNAFAAVFAAAALDNRDAPGDATAPILPSSAIEAFSTFEPLAHRLAPIASAAGRTFYDDSIATTPESAIAALDSFDEPVVLLAGGSDKKLDLSELARAISANAKAVALLGTTGPQLDELISKQNPGRKRFLAESLASAFEWAVKQSSPGDAVVLSPGCASLDWFRNFQDRGEQFAKLARTWAEQNR